jgi:hypothetical protein
MRTKEYIQTCEICNKTYIASRAGSSVCSNKCRAKKSRDRKDRLFDQLLSPVPVSDEFELLVINLAKIRGKDQNWIDRKLMLHKKLLISDAHHSYNEQSAIADIKEDIKYWKKHNPI